jgi:hypothetical protein
MENVGNLTIDGSTTFLSEEYFSFSGDQTQISQDVSHFRTGSWSTSTSGTLYSTVGDYVMWYWSHNMSLDSGGNFLGSEDSGPCTLFVFTEGTTGLGYPQWNRYDSIPAAAGTVPTFTLNSSLDQLGFNGDIGITTPATANFATESFTFTASPAGSSTKVMTVANVTAFAALQVGQELTFSGQTGAVIIQSFGTYTPALGTGTINLGTAQTWSNNTIITVLAAPVTNNGQVIWINNGQQARYSQDTSYLRTGSSFVGATFVASPAGSASSVMTVSSITNGAYLVVGQQLTFTGQSGTVTIASFGTYTVASGTGTINLSSAQTWANNTVVTSGGFYSLMQDTAMYFISHNAPIDTSGANNLSGRDDTGPAHIWSISEGQSGSFTATTGSGTSVMNISAVLSGYVVVGATLTFTGQSGTVTITSFGTFNGTSGTVNLSSTQTWTNPVTVASAGPSLFSRYDAPSGAIGTVPSFTRTYFQDSIGINTVIGVTTPYAGTFTNLVVTAQSATVTPIILTTGTLNTTPVAGGVEFNGQNLYFSSVASQRALIQTEYYYRSNTATTLGTSGSWLGTGGTPLTTGVTLQASTVYEFEGEFELTTTGTTSHTEAIGFTYTTMTVNNMFCAIERTPAQLSTGGGSTAVQFFTSGSSGSTVMTGSITTAQTVLYRVKGTVSVNAGGSLLPVITFSAAPGGTSTAVLGAWFRICPIGPAGQISIGTWS